jgi:hypothetical protein
MEYFQLNQQHEPQEAEIGQGEVEMREADTNLVQKQLSELAQQVVHVILACNKETDILKDKFNLVKNGIIIMESRLQTKKVRIEAEVAGVGLMIHFLEGMLQ